MSCISTTYSGEPVGLDATRGQRRAGQRAVALQEDQARGRRRQRRDVRGRLLRAWARLDELRGYVSRDRAAERRERGRLIRQLEAARERQAELDDLLRAYLRGQAPIDAEAAAQRAREALTSGFGEIGP